MKIGTTIISTEEYMKLRAMRDNLEARKAEIEANVDKILVQTTMWGTTTGVDFLGKDAALNILQVRITELTTRANAHPKPTIPNRLRFLFTGNIEYEVTEK